jgi:dihydrofolate synthase/folylpolyglutamate synthase
MGSELLTFLLANYGQEQMRPGLERSREALRDLLPQLQTKRIVTVAGTNGKGETTLRLSGLLKQRRHVTWTSPHIVRLTERFRNQDGEISEAELERLVFACHEKVRRERLELSFYEFLFLVFCTWAREQGPEILLLEVGLGGRLDAVNVFDADLVLLPSISRDHQEILGRRYDQILAEKLGTLRRKTTLIHFLDNRYLVDRAQGIAGGVGAAVVSLRDLYPLPGYEFSLRNHVLAGAAYCALEGRPFSPGDWRAPEVRLENRGEVFRGENRWLFFGSHNVDGLRKLIQFLQRGTYNFERPPYDAVVVAFSKRSPEDLRVMLKMLKKANLGTLVVTAFAHPKAAGAPEMEVLAREEGSEFVHDIDAYVQGRNKGQRILVTGSYYFLGHVKSLPGCR